MGTVVKEKQSENKKPIERWVMHRTISPYIFEGNESEAGLHEAYRKYGEPLIKMIDMGTYAELRAKYDVALNLIRKVHAQYEINPDWHDLAEGLINAE